MAEAQRLSPTDRAEWLKLRQQDVTASDIGALVTTDHPYCTKFDLWARKSGKIASDISDNLPMRIGRKLEPLLAELALEAMPDVTDAAYNSTNQYWRLPEHRIGATPDLIVESPRGRGAIQLKNVNPDVYARKWIAGEPPLYIALQALTEAKLTGAKWAAVGVLHGYQFDLVEIPMAAGAWARLLNEVAAFWKLVETDTPPTPDYARDAEIIAELHPASAGSSIDLSADNELMDALHTRELAKERLKTCEEVLDGIDGLIRHKCGTNETIFAGPFRINMKAEHVRAHTRTIAAYTRRPIRVKRLKENAA